MVESGPLLDPQEPTRAATLEIMAALVVSKETVQGGSFLYNWKFLKVF